MRPSFFYNILTGFMFGTLVTILFTGLLPSQPTKLVSEGDFVALQYQRNDELLNNVKPPPQKLAPLLSPPFEEHVLSEEDDDFTWTIVTTFRAKDTYEKRSETGFKSWKILNPRPKIVFLSDGKDEDYLRKMAKEFGAEIGSVRTNAYGTPLVSNVK
jgi:hypothetical protein